MSLQVLHKVGAERAAAAVLTLDTPGANYRTVWALSKNFPHVKTFVRAHDVEHGLNLERAGATAVRCIFGVIVSVRCYMQSIRLSLTVRVD